MIRLRIDSRLHLLAMPLLLWAFSAKAAWDIVPEIALRAAAQHNPKLEVDATVPETTGSSIVDAKVTLSSYGERGFIRVEPRVNVNVYKDSYYADLDGDDWYLEGRGEYRWRNASVGFRSDFRRRGIQRSELLVVEDPDLDDPDTGGDLGDDSGRLTFFEETQDRHWFQPYVNFRLSERSTFRLDFDEIDVSYSQGATSSWTGYRQRTARATINRRVSDRSQVSAGLVASDYEADVNFNETRTVGLQASIRRNVSELWTIGLRTGVGRSDFSFQDQVTLETVDNADANYTLTVNATHRGERQTLDLSVARRLTPSSTGFFTERNELEMYLDRELAPRVSLRIGAIANESKSVGAQAPPNLRDYARFELGFNWRVRPRWSLITGYNYTSQDFPEEGTGRRTYDVLYCGIRYSGLSRPGAPR